MFRFKVRFAFAAALFALAAATPAAAQTRAQVGVLECRGFGAVSFVVGSVNDFGCIFKPAAGRPQRYLATIRRFGVDLGVSGQSVLTWLLHAPPSSRIIARAFGFARLPCSATRRAGQIFVRIPGRSMISKKDVSDLRPCKSVRRKRSPGALEKQRVIGATHERLANPPCRLKRYWRSEQGDK